MPATPKPTFNCSRLNIAENNSPTPRDRVYFQYNHFHNITELDILGGFLPDNRGTNDLSIDRFTFGLEKSFFHEQMSVEIRIPFARELTSEPSLRVNQNVDNLPLDDIATEFGNVSLISKLKIYETGTLLLSGGLALRIPTADNVNYSIRLVNDMFPLPAGAPFPFFPLNASYRGTLENETYNLSPFAAALWTPSDRLFVQGFLQFDLPLNESGFSLRGTVNTPVGPIPINGIVAGLKQQSLMRLNVGGGYWLYRNPCGCFLTGLAALIEVHYTTTLEDADIIRGDVPFFFSQPPLSADLEVGNRANRNDILNLTLGSTAEIRKSTTLATGFVIPLREASDKPFDFEFNLQLNHRF